MAQSDTLDKLMKLLGDMSEVDLQQMIGKAERKLGPTTPRKKPRDLASDKVLTRGGSGRTGFWKLYDRIVLGRPSPRHDEAGVVKRGRKKVTDYSSKFKGVYKSTNATNKKRPYYVQWESIFVGQYESEENAARAYDAIEHKITGEIPNFPSEVPWEFEPSPDA